ncbi:hypothetical protein CkaCkLH20_05539 [Colletotrichum karsti]|uniref:Ankyrin repeat protein n=1 Tax=Colletotrichum karsti TaxID=1095194 RepID=A0A9P6I5C3_9PEZI|nr:uncharacterized protein CkaCkLH20_05539 [Colletotrichum karsti]KAF9876693.1 hypothetical protein CkaCkLH20_05539 [Colletotrichum karsti]
MWQAFLDHGWDINRPYSTADPPTLAWILEDKELVEWFLAHGANPNAEARYGWTPWLRAIVWAPLEIVKLLHEAGGRLDLAVPYVCYGRTSPNHAAKFPDRMDVLQYLLDAGADIDARMWSHNRYGRMSHFDFGSAVNIAVYCGKDDIVEELLRRGARTDIAADKMVDDGSTALEFAKKRAPHLVSRLEERRRQENEGNHKHQDGS